MSATLKFTDYLNNKKKLNVPTTLPVGNEPVMSTGEIGNVTMPKYTDALNGSSFGNTKQQLPSGIQQVQPAEATPKYSDTVKPGMLTPGSEQVGYTAMPKYTDAVAPKYDEPTSSPTPDVTVTEPLSFEEYILSLKSKADDQYKRDILNAQNTYDQSRSAYGAQAAALGNMGLTGSGYSDYLDSRAYGQMQADKNAAAATKAATIADADAKYTEYLDAQETTRKNAYSSILSEIDNYTDAQIDALGKQFGFSSPEISALKTARTDAIKQEASTAGVESFKDDHGKLKPVNEAQAEIDQLTAAGVDTTNVQKTFDSLYKVYTKDGITFNKDGGLKDRPGKKGNNISLTGRGDKKYRVQYSGETGDANVKAAAQNLPANTVFMYNGVVYLKYSDGECYGIEARPLFGWDKHYKELVEALKDETTT